MLAADVQNKMARQWKLLRHYTAQVHMQLYKQHRRIVFSMSYRSWATGSLNKLCYRQPTNDTSLAWSLQYKNNYNNDFIRELFEKIKSICSLWHLSLLSGRDKLCLLHLAGKICVTMTRGWIGAYRQHQDQTDVKYHDPCSMSKALTCCLIFLACYSLLITAFGLWDAPGLCRISWHSAFVIL